MEEHTVKLNAYTEILVLIGIVTAAIALYSNPKVSSLPGLDTLGIIINGFALLLLASWVVGIFFWNSIKLSKNKILTFVVWIFILLVVVGLVISEYSLLKDKAMKDAKNGSLIMSNNSIKHKQINSSLNKTQTIDETKIIRQINISSNVTKR